MKISFLLSLLLTCTLLDPAEPVACYILKQNFEDISSSEYSCRSRPDFKLLGGPGCQVSCLTTNSTCAELENQGEVCGKLRLRIGFYAFGRVTYEFCLLPDGNFFQRRSGRYCLTLRYCVLQQRACGCRVVVDGRPCRCRLEEQENGSPRPVSSCPLVNEGGDSSSFMTDLLPSEDEFNTEMSMNIEDNELANGLEEAYSIFMNHIESL